MLILNAPFHCMLGGSIVITNNNILVLICLVQLETHILLLKFVSALPFEVVSKLDTLQLNLFTVELKLLSSHVVKSGQTIIA